jgi:uncharacterized protein YprB with RNaseH-like and TPR domain
MANRHDDYDALAATAHISGLEGYRAYVALGGTRGFDGWEVKRRRINVDAPPRVPVQAAGPDYVGLTIGYFDIETTFSTQPIMLYGAIADAFGNVRQFRKGPDITDDKELVNTYARALEEYDILVSWNGKLFDVPVLGGRLAFHGLPPLNLKMHSDAMYYATGQFARIGRKSLQSVSEYFEVQNQKTPLRVRQWDGAMAGKPEEYEKIVTHCDADVLVLRDVFNVLKRFIRTIHRAG